MPEGIENLQRDCRLNCAVAFNHLLGVHARIIAHNFLMPRRTVVKTMRAVVVARIQSESWIGREQQQRLHGLAEDL